MQIQESEEELKKLQSEIVDPDVKKRIQYLIYRKQGISVNYCTELIGVTRQTISTWNTKYKKKGIEGLITGVHKDLRIKETEAYLNSLWKNEANPLFKRRLQILLELKAGKKYTEIMQELDITQTSIYDCIGLYRASGIEGVLRKFQNPLTPEEIKESEPKLEKLLSKVAPEQKLAVEFLLLQKRGQHYKLTTQPNVISFIKARRLSMVYREEGLDGILKFQVIPAKNSKLRNRVVEIATSQGINSASELSETCNIPLSTARDVWNGTYAGMSQRTQEALVRGLGCKVGELLGLD